MDLVAAALSALLVALGALVLRVALSWTTETPEGGGPP